MKTVLAEIQALERKITDKIAYKGPKEAIQDAIGDLNYLPNAVASWVEAFGGDKTKANEAGRKLKALVNTLSEILMQMPDPVSYTVYGLPEGIKKFDTRDKLVYFMEGKGFTFSGDNNNRSSRVELQGQPTFKGIMGPMYDGGGKVRYETPELYESLSR